jgi:hypothetical protein
MVGLWITSCFCYGLINLYMKYIPGSIFLNFSISGLSEIAAHVTVGLLYVKLTPRWTFFIGYSIAAAGGVCLLFQNQYENEGLLAFFVLLAKFGISMSMCACYVSTPFVFPVVLSGTAFGICNIFGRFFAIGTAFVAEWEIPLPMELFTAFSIAGAILCLFVSPKEEDAVSTLPRTSAKVRKSNTST